MKIVQSLLRVILNIIKVKTGDQQFEVKSRVDSHECIP
jgi:hypothetical protein